MAPILRNGGSQSPDRWLKEHRNNHALDQYVLAKFTFHNVSINTGTRTIDAVDLCDLHSTMFLLIRVFSVVSVEVFKNLHSTMFLLILLLMCRLNSSSSLFTFHNVSINTHSRLLQILHSHQFTFHNVSINTNLPHT